MEVMTPFEIELLRAYADCNMRVSSLAKQMYVHYNTVYYHLDKIHRETGLNPRTFRDLVELLSRIERGEAEE